MKYPTIKRLKELVAPMSDEAIVLALGVTKDGDIKLLTCGAEESGSAKLAATEGKAKWMQRV